MTRIGYFVPEFPLFTHVFFWRELQVLKKFENHIEIFSTKKPSDSLSGNHRWVKEVREGVTYLLPYRPSLADLLEFLRTPPIRWLKVIKIICTAKDVSKRERIGLLAAAILGLKMKRMVRKSGLEHLHSHFAYRGADIVLFASILAKVDYSLTYHGDLCGVGNQINKWSMAKFGICITEYSKRRLTETIGCDNLPNKVFIAPMGVDTDSFARVSTYKPYSGLTAFRVFSVGRITVSKGHAETIRAVARIAESGVKIELRIAGGSLEGDDHMDELKDLVRDLGLQNDVHFLGVISSEEVKTELESCHAFVLASFQEEFGVAYAEAMSMSVPTVGTNAGGVAELIIDGESGLLAKPKNVTDLADKLSLIIRDPALSERLSRGVENAW